MFDTGRSTKTILLENAFSKLGNGLEEIEQTMRKHTDKLGNQVNFNLVITSKK
jgi:hypothetical protein